MPFPMKTALLQSGTMQKVSFSVQHVAENVVFMFLYRLYVFMFFA